MSNQTANKQIKLDLHTSTNALEDMIKVSNICTLSTPANKRLSVGSIFGWNGQVCKFSSHFFNHRIAVRDNHKEFCVME